MLQGWTVVQDPSGSMGPYAYKAAYTHTAFIFFDIQPEYQVLEDTLQRHCTENLNQIVLEMKLRGLVHNSYIHVYVGNFYIPRICLLILQQQNRWTDPGNI